MIEADSEPCPICLNNMKDTANELNDGGLAVLEKCSHIYHTSCIKAWSDVTNSCPLCKSRFTVLSVFQTYSGCLSYLASDRIVTESMGLLRDERVPNRDQHDATEDFISLDEVYYEDDGVQCTDFCYLRNGAPFTEDFIFLSSATPARIGFTVAASVSHLNSIPQVYGTVTIVLLRIPKQLLRNRHLCK